MPDDAVTGLELTEIAASSEPLPRRAEALLGALRLVVSFDGAWLALADPHRPVYTALASAGLADSTLAFLAGPQFARDIELAGGNRAAPPLSPSDLPFPAFEMASWAACLLPAGFHEGLGTALFAADGQRVGHISLLFGSRAPPSTQVRRTLGRCTAVLAHGIDPRRSLVLVAQLVQGAVAGVVLHEDGGIGSLPGLEGHELLAADSPVLAAARASLRAGRVYLSFLWPLGGRQAPQGHVRVTCLARTEDVPVFLTGAVLLSPPEDLRGLTPRELEVLGLLINGCSNGEIARALVVAQRTVAAHVENILVKLAAPTRTLAAVRAERAGLYVPRRRDTSPRGR